MASLFSAAPPNGGPGYSFTQTPSAAAGEPRQHGFYPYAHCPIYPQAQSMQPQLAEAKIT